MISLGFCACAGYRSGWESLPYVGEAPPTPPVYRTPFEAMKRSELALPGLTLSVSLNNQVRTSQSEVYLYVLPLSVDPGDVPIQQVAPGRTRVTLRISHHEGAFVFRPRMARLGTGERWIFPADGLVFEMRDQTGSRVHEGGAWGYHPIGEQLVLADPDATYVLAIEFPVEVPSPQSRDVVLDLSRALQAPRKADIPLIRFLPVRWNEGYT